MDKEISVNLSCKPVIMACVPLTIFSQRLVAENLLFVFRVEFYDKRLT